MKKKKDSLERFLFQAAFFSDEEASVILYRKGSSRIEEEIPFVSDPYNGVLRTAEAKIDPAQTEYNFRLGKRIIQDPEAKVIRGRVPFGDPRERAPHQIRCGFPCREFDWEGDLPLRIPYEEVIAYSLHVRGFTRQKNSGVRHKGTFRGLTEKIPYLRELGINQVILMPAYEFEEAEHSPVAGMNPVSDRENFTGRINYWGYTEGWYFAPKAGYAAGDAPDLEFKEMVKALHTAGIEVVMEFAFPDETGAETVIRALTWWMREYHVDGFSLLCARETARQAALAAPLARVKLMTGYFDPGAVYPKGRPLGARTLANLNDGFKADCRRLLKGDENMLEAFVRRQRQNEGDVAWVNYIAGHDGFTLMDLVSYDRKHNEENGEQGRDGAESDFSWNCGAEGPSRKGAVRKLRLRQRKNAMAMLLLAQGTPLLLAGDEFGNSQGGNNNPWCIDSEVTWVDWSKRKTEAELTEFIRQLIRFRQAHPVLHRAQPFTGGDTISCGYPDVSCHGSRAWYGAFDYQNRHVGLMYCGLHAGEEAFIYVAYNFHWEEQSFALPYLPEGMDWRVVIDTGESTAVLNEPLPLPVREFTVPGRTVRVLLGSEGG